MLNLTNAELLVTLRALLDKARADLTEGDAEQAAAALSIAGPIAYLLDVTPAEKNRK